ncbi:MAG TPA: aminotransferase class V-fold PLP-dependent enzyme [Candidatus Acidoferrales bacterium]|nr:aminotransferase class V-fold PLP-dependent enzyme [Candidatus Acidoferrales bacterium]
MSHDYRREFADFEGVAYLNVANQGPLPLIAARAAQAAIETKKLPYKITDNLYFDIPDRIRKNVAQLIGAEADEIAITSGASAGLSFAAAGIEWQPGDEVLVGRGEFPAHVAAWLPYIKAGKLRVRTIAPRERFITAEDYEREIGPQTRLVSASLVRFDDGAMLDAKRVSKACHAANALLMIDASQCAGAIPLSVRDLGADFVTSSGYKWMLGPYGTGFFWASPEWMNRFPCGPFYWQALEGARNFHFLPLDELKAAPGARRWDSAETGNFINLSAWDASLELLVKIGTDAIAKHDAELVGELIERLPRDRFVLASPSQSKRRGPYVCISARNPERNREICEKLREEQIIVSLREKALRVSPYLYNTTAEVDRLVKALAVA